MQKSSVKISAESDSVDLILSIKLDGEVFFRDNIPESGITIEHEFDDEPEVEHCLEFTLSGKMPSHTILDEDNEIIDDKVIRITSFELDSTRIDHLLKKNTRYCHDYNGTRLPVDESFQAFLGCNGTATFRFRSPGYVWILEHS